MCLIYNACRILTLRMIMAMREHDAAWWAKAVRKKKKKLPTPCCFTERKKKRFWLFSKFGEKFVMSFIHIILLGIGEHSGFFFFLVLWGAVVVVCSFFKALCRVLISWLVTYFDAFLFIFLKLSHCAWGAFIKSSCGGVQPKRQTLWGSNSKAGSLSSTFQDIYFILIA